MKIEGSKLVSSLRRSFAKNVPEVKTFLAGRMPAFVTQDRGAVPASEVPVFVFHAVEPERFEAQLLYLQANCYQTLDAAGVEAAIQKGMWQGREVALTFDDGTWTFWTFAFPLLKKYGFQAILFAIPGIVPEDSTPYANLKDVWEGKCSHEELTRRGKVQPLCTWRELALMHASGIVDVQSHSLTHARVPVAPRLVDFLHPGFDTYAYANLNIPVSSLDNLENPERILRLGAPVFETAPRLACRFRFKETPELVENLMSYVKEHGGEAFFRRPNWRKELTALFRGWPAANRGSFETLKEMHTAVRRELVESKKLLEAKLPGKVVRHFCYPWFIGSAMADQLAAEAGYRTIHYGLEGITRSEQTTGPFLRIRRISEEYLFRLPGDGRLSIWSIWMDRVHRSRVGRGRVT